MKDKVELMKEVVREELGERISFFVTRSDGVLLFDFHGKETRISADSVSSAVLICGAWQAAEMLLKQMNTKDLANFRLSFDSSNHGIVIMPLKSDKQTFYAGMLFGEEINPAPLKFKMKSLLKKLSPLLVASEVIQEEERKGFLFDDISDDEMDALFSFQGAR